MTPVQKFDLEFKKEYFQNFIYFLQDNLLLKYESLKPQTRHDKRVFVMKKVLYSGFNIWLWFLIVDFMLQISHLSSLTLHSVGMVFIKNLVYLIPPLIIKRSFLKRKKQQDHADSIQKNINYVIFSKLEDNNFKKQVIKEYATLKRANLIHEADEIYMINQIMLGQTMECLEFFKLTKNTIENYIKSLENIYERESKREMYLDELFQKDKKRLVLSLVE